MEIFLGEESMDIGDPNSRYRMDFLDGENCIRESEAMGQVDWKVKKYLPEIYYSKKDASGGCKKPKELRFLLTSLLTSGNEGADIDDQALKFVDRLENTLRHFRLIWRIGGVELRAVTDSTNYRWDVVVVNACT